MEKVKAAALEDVMDISAIHISATPSSTWARRQVVDNRHER